MRTPAEYFNNCIGVFQGGGCKAIAYIGAYKRAHELGIMFSEVAGTSAGSIIAAMIAIGCSPQKLEEIIKTVNFSELQQRAVISGNILKHIFTKCIYIIITSVIHIVLTIGFPLYCVYYIISLVKVGIRYIINRYHFKNIVGYKRKVPQFNYYKWYSYSSYLTSYFINCSWGIFDSSILRKKIEDWFEECGVSRGITFAELPIQLHIVSTDVFKRQVKIWNAKNTPSAQVSKAVTASCSIPIFFTPIDYRHVDGGVISNRPDYIFYEEEHKYTKILSFSLTPSSKHYRGRFEFVKDLISTIIDGSDKLQHDMLPNLPDAIVIDHGDIDATSFNKITPSKINELISYGVTAIDNFLAKQDEEHLLHLINTSRGKILSRERLYTQIASWSLTSPQYIIIYEPTLNWVWSLFPTLISWINAGVKIVIYTEDLQLKQTKAILNEIKQKNRCTKQEAIVILEERIEITNGRIRLLEQLGCRINKYKNNRIRGFFYKYKDKPYVGIGIKYPDEYKKVYADNNITAKIYTDRVDSALLDEQFSALKVSNDFKNMNKPIPCKIIQTDNVRSEIENRLRVIPYYSSAEFEWCEIGIADLKNLIFLNPQLRGFKYIQTLHIFELFGWKNLFNPTAIKLPSENLSYMAPIVVEEHEGKLYVIKGNTRCLYAWRHNIDSLTILVIKGVAAHLPVHGDPKEYQIDSLFVSDEPISGITRYGNNFNKDLYRDIEKALRPYDTYLK